VILEELLEHWWEILHLIRPNANTQFHSKACRYAWSNTEAGADAARLSDFSPDHNQ
jgi:hypothetical protein